MELYILAIGLVCLVVLIIILLMMNRKFNEMKQLRNEINSDTTNLINNLGSLLNSATKNNNELMSERLREMNTSLSKLNETSVNNNEIVRKQLFETTNALEEKVNGLTNQNGEKLEAMRLTLENKITALQEDNAKKLEAMRVTVDEKLQETLDKRISQSFQLVSERLEQVYKGLGEMQTLASGVGDLKKVLSNVKTRGILGEIQLGAILEEVLSAEQYEQNVVTKPGSSNRVEFAIKLPADDNHFIYLPIDSKFPGDKYAQLVDAYDVGDQEKINLAIKELDTVIKKSAKDIRDKYIDVPNTTEFGIMFLPFEGLYAEVVRRGLVEVLQREYKINIAGPTTMAALLNALQMGFKTLAIQKRSSEVWEVLGAVKTEFDKFGAVLENTQTRLNQAQKELDDLVGVRTRKIVSRLNKIQTIEPKKAIEVIDKEEFSS